jgi:dihydrodipicolinate synthase/N-acetylneuraminate lyase
VVTVLDEAGGLLEADQRAVCRWVIQEGWGADVVFAAGTTGEWDRVDNATRQQVIQVCADEVAKANAALGPGAGRPVECWAGITSHDRREVLENLEFAVCHGADAAVLAPLSIPGLDDPVRFVARDLADLLDRCRRRIPLYLYDNADIAADPKVPHIRTRQVKALSRLDFVRGVKVSARRKVLGDYMKAARDFGERGSFGIYVGNAHLIFHIFRPRRGPLGAASATYQRWRLRGGIPVGVVAGPANVLPREWARAWQVCRAGDAERMAAVEEVLDAWRAATRAAGAGLACTKRALVSLGVTTSAAVAPGTTGLEPERAKRFDEAFEAVRALAAARLIEPWQSRTAEEPRA